VFVAATTECFKDLPLESALERLADLEFSSVELALFEEGGHLKPSSILANPEAAVGVCRNLQRLDLIGFDCRFGSTGQQYYDEFTAICRLAKLVKVVTITIPSAELGTPFNEEVEHLQKVVQIATKHGVRVAMKTQVGRLAEDPDTIGVLCDNAKGLGITLDPSCFVIGPAANRSIEKIMKYVHHVQLRDTSKKAFQVRVGQGEVEYNRLVSQLEKVSYKHGLSVNITEMPDVEHTGEMRKMRLFLETLL
jgi:sugar phosphate isomerase/epimerase